MVFYVCLSSCFIHCFIMLFRYGFNSDGHDTVLERLQNLRKSETGCIIGVNLGKNKTSSDPVNDYVEGIKTFGEVADYLVVNISRHVLFFFV